MAEVLITLGIIGVVAAITMPTLISNYKKQETVVKLKKAYSIISQAFKLSQLDNDEYINWQIPNTASDYINKYFMSYLNGAKICYTVQECGYSSDRPFKTLSGVSHNMLAVHNSFRLPVILNDGMYIIFSVQQGSNNGNIVSNSVTVDINGAKAPNQIGKDVFSFKLNRKGIVLGDCKPGNTLLEHDCIQGGEGFNCACKIMENNWEIPKDYPLKF